MKLQHKNNRLLSRKWYWTIGFHDFFHSSNSTFNKKIKIAFQKTKLKRSSLLICFRVVIQHLTRKQTLYSRKLYWKVSAIALFHGTKSTNSEKTKIAFEKTASKSSSLLTCFSELNQRLTNNKDYLWENDIEK